MIAPTGAASRPFIQIGYPKSVQPCATSQGMTMDLKERERGREELTTTVTCVFWEVESLIFWFTTLFSDPAPHQLHSPHTQYFRKAPVPVPVPVPVLVLGP